MTLKAAWAQDQGINVDPLGKDGWVKIETEEGSHRSFLAVCMLEHRDK